MTAPLDLAGRRERAQMAAFARRLGKVRLALAVLDGAPDLAERLTEAECLAIAVLGREVCAILDDAAAEPARVIPFRRQP